MNREQSRELPVMVCRALEWGATSVPLSAPLDCIIFSGTVVAITGCNGAGKSSLLKTMGGLLLPLGGLLEVAVNRRREAAYLAQNATIDRHFPCSVGDIVAAGFWNVRLPRRERTGRIHDALATWRLNGLADKPLSQLSGGELQRVLLARLTVMEAKLLLMDEPTTALDADAKERFWSQVGRWQQEGRTQIIVCHDLENARVHCHQEIRLQAGRPVSIDISKHASFTFGAAAQEIPLHA